ncbi:hypothetical protein GIB67_026225 [Kingdonia uniflora]|uniref:MORF/ORRM1/DAG-like MORF domain-containing protein n=1 Tax=Kingdonia uniflora TaxID=39325 RepID=A0A7J7L9V3_9MAGN|nr:hypothetical protein GIB67_026225 [Kingdonia uniflora]
MAMSSLRLRRALTLSSSLLKPQPTISPLSPSPILQPHVSASPPSLSSVRRNRIGDHFRIHSKWFSSSGSYNNDDDKISPDTILFEGCDYNHWLITMDFPKDPRPTSEEMVETYVQTLAKVVGSVEEAKQKMYACSTTTYNGFQAVMTEEMSEKFRGLPGVVFILPDSYIDPKNKEYGGDKYINGTIIPRPPPVQYGRTAGRFGDRNRNNDRRQREPMPMQQGNQPYDRQGSMQGDGRWGTQQNYPPQQNYGPPGQGGRRDSMPMGSWDGAPPGRENYPRQSSNQPSYQNEGYRGNLNAPGQSSFPQGGQADNMNFTPPPGPRNFTPPPDREYGQGNGTRNFTPPPGGEYGQENGTRNFTPPPGGEYGQGNGTRNFTPPPGGEYVQGNGTRNFTPPPGGEYGQGNSTRNFTPPPGGEYVQGNGTRNFTPPPGGEYGQGAGSRNFTPPSGGDFGQGAGFRNFNPPSERNYGQGAVSGYGQSYPGQGDGQRLPRVNQSDGMQEEQRNYTPMPPMSNDQV